MYIRRRKVARNVLVALKVVTDVAHVIAQKTSHTNLHNKKAVSGIFPARLFSVLF
jgi:hypothetical protein